MILIKRVLMVSKENWQGGVKLKRTSWTNCPPSLSGSCHIYIYRTDVATQGKLPGKFKLCPAALQNSHWNLLCGELLSTLCFYSFIFFLNFIIHLIFYIVTDVIQSPGFATMAGQSQIINLPYIVILRNKIHGCNWSKPCCVMCTILGYSL